MTQAAPLASDMARPTVAGVQTPDSRGRPADASVLLSVQSVAVRFGGVVALDGISFDVGRGQICGVIGPNGAGKTTLFNCLSRLYTPHSGAIWFDGRDLLAQRQDQMAAMGIGRTFQNVALFGAMSVLDNVMVGQQSRCRSGYFAHAFGAASVRREEQALRAAAMDLIHSLGLAAVADREAGGLPFATRKRVELARALASSPQLLLLDEPAGGLNHEEVDALRQQIVELRDRLHLTVLLVEHHLNLVMRVSDKVVAMDFGRKIADGPPADVQAHPEVVRAYLGADA